MLHFEQEFINLFIRLCVASALGGLVGLERDIHGRAAGLRTHLLIGVGAALFMILSQKIALVGFEMGRVGDPGRIAAQIVSGIGFLGAGAIMKEGFSVRGLTTATCFWVVAAIGMAAGAGYYQLAAGTTLISLISLSFLNRIDSLYRRDSYRVLTLRASSDVPVSELLKSIQRENLKIIFVDIDRDYESRIITLRLSLCLFHKGTTDKMFQDILDSMEQAHLPIKSISWAHGKML